MKRDTLFYKIFQQAPDRLFELIAAVVTPGQLPVPLPPAASAYQFSSVEVKETAFRIDGVFVPPTADLPVFFAEVQMQRDNYLNERVFSEVGLFLRQNYHTFSDWQVLLIYPSRAVQQPQTKIPPELFHSGRFLPIYLDELGEISQLPLGLGLMVLTVTEDSVAVAGARNLIARCRGLAAENAIIAMVAEIVVYKFNQLTREEVDAMLEIRLQDTRVYQEAKAEGLTEGREEGRTEGREEGRTEGREEGRTEGRAEGQRATVLMLLEQKAIDLSAADRQQIDGLNSEQLTELTRALLSFNDVQGLQQWLQSHS
jgi:predicted transposase/invertase (TIGR01784 family)